MPPNYIQGYLLQAQQNQFMNSKIKAAIRIRPFIASQIKHGYVNSCIKSNKTKGEIEVDDGQNCKKFNFDYIFNEKTTQSEIYNECNIDHLIDKALKGYHTTIFAYGQTGSGKTFTMHGDESLEDKISDGLIPNIFNNLFQQISSINSRNFMISMSFLQIYNEKIYDLLNPISVSNSKTGAQGLKLRWNKDEQFSVQNLFIFQCQNKHDLMHHFGQGLKNRIQATHKLNLQSSRSHSILTIRIQSFDRFDPNNILSSKIQLVDLAGSQRIGLTGTTGKQAQQSIDINKSLFTLRQVISILSQSSKSKNKHQKVYVPYRDSKLTSILKQSIGGNSYCLMIACINPNDAFFEQNVSTLTYATKASYITNQPTVNDDPRSKVINDLKRQVKGLTQQLAKANQHIEMVTNLHKKQPRISQTTQQINSVINRNSREKKSQYNTDMGDQFSQRLVQSINMVRQLLKSNKQLRQKLQESNHRNDEKDVQIYQLSKQNQIFKQRLNGYSPFPEEVQTQQKLSGFQRGIRTSSSVHRKKQTPNPKPQTAQLQHHQTQSGLLINPNSVNNSIKNVANGPKSNFNYWNSVQINQYYMNERGVDSVPTNFSRKQINSSHQRRIPVNKSIVNDRSRMSSTSKFNSRAWKNVGQNPNKFFSFYQQHENY